MEIKLINAAYQDKKQMKHAKTTSHPPKGGGGSKVSSKTGYNFFFNVKMKSWRFLRDACLIRLLRPLGPPHHLRQIGDRGKGKKEGRKERDRETTERQRD